MKDNKKWGIGLNHAINGIWEAIKRERNFRIHLCVATIVIFCAIYFHLSIQEWAILLIMIQLVFITELINSVVERIIDYVKPESHPEAKIIKDISAAVVLIAAITSVSVGCFIFLPKIFG